MTPSEKGQIGLTKVISHLVESGNSIYIPLIDSNLIDLISTNQKLIPKTFQIKYRKSKNGKIDLTFSSVVNGKRIYTDPTLVDYWVVYWVVYCSDLDKIYYIDSHKYCLGKRNFVFRVLPSKYLPKYDKVLIDEFGRVPEW